MVVCTNTGTLNLSIWAVAGRYEFYFLVLKTVFYSLAVLVRKILFLPLQNKIHIFAPPWNILYIMHQLSAKVQENNFFVEPAWFVRWRSIHKVFRETTVIQLMRQ